MLLAHRSLVAGGRNWPGWAPWLAVKVWFRRPILDRELAEAASPDTDPARALRARQLSSRRCRRHLADGLRLLVAEARRPPNPMWPPLVPLNRRQVVEARAPMLLLADRLVEGEEPTPRAVALASFLVRDPYSPATFPDPDPDIPMFSSLNGATTAQLARAALAAVDRRPPCSSGNGVTTARFRARRARRDQPTTTEVMPNAAVQAAWRRRAPGDALPEVWGVHPAECAGMNCVRMGPA